MNYYEDTPRFISSLLDVVDLLTATRSTDSTTMKRALFYDRSYKSHGMCTYGKIRATANMKLLQQC